MTNNKKMFRLIFFIFVILVVITIGLIIYSLDNNRITPYAGGTQVGYVYIGGKNTWQAESELSSRISEWKNSKNLTIEIRYQNSAYKIPIDPSIFEFDIERSIEAVQSNKVMDYENNVNVIKVYYKDSNYIREELEKHYTNLKFSDFDIDGLKDEILKYVSFLYKEIYIDLGAYVNEEKAQVTMVGDSVELLYQNADYFKRNRYDYIVGDIIEIKPKSQFSLNEFLFQYYEEIEIPETEMSNVADLYSKFFSEDELNILATGLYQTILKTNFINISKETSKKLPAFVRQAGYEAKSEIGFDYTTKNEQGSSIITDIEFINKKDLSFYNPNYYSYYISIRSSTNQFGQQTLVFQLYGTPFINEYEIIETVTQDKREIPPEIVVWYETTWENRALNPGEEIQIHEGYPGYWSILARKTIISFPNENEDMVVHTVLSEDIYMPKNAIIVKYDEELSE